VVVRVPLRGRRVRGCVLADDVEPDTDRARLVPLLAVVSAGPSDDVLALSAWGAWRWAGPRAVFLPAASPPNDVHPVAAPEPDHAVYPVAALPAGVGPLDAAGRGPSSPRVLSWPPARPRDELIAALLAPEGSTIVVVPDPLEEDALAVRLA